MLLCSPLRRATVQVRQAVVKVRAPIAEQSPDASRGLQFIEIEFCNDDVLAIPGRLDDLVTGRVRNERVAVESQFTGLARLDTDAVGCQNRHTVGRSVSLHRTLPVAGRIHIRKVWLGTDGCRVHQHVRSIQCHAAGRLGKPLGPANGDANAGILRLPDPKSGVTRAEIELLLVTGPVGDVRFSVNAEQTAVGVDDADRIEVNVVCLFEETDR